MACGKRHRWRINHHVAYRHRRNNMVAAYHLWLWRGNVGGSSAKAAA